MPPLLLVTSHIILPLFFHSSTLLDDYILYYFKLPNLLPQLSVLADDRSVKFHLCVYYFGDWESNHVIIPRYSTLWSIIIELCPIYIMDKLEALFAGQIYILMLAYSMPKYIKFSYVN